MDTEAKDTADRAKPLPIERGVVAEMDPSLFHTQGEWQYEGPYGDAFPLRRKMGSTVHATFPSAQLLPRA
jgi:hypothetical protein